jgi:hypothetical protein
MTRVWLMALALLVAGCTGSDLCGDAPDGAVCATVHLTGKIDPEAQITSLQVDSLYADGSFASSPRRTRRRIVTPQIIDDGGLPSLPIAFTVFFESPAVVDLNARIIVAALDGTRAVGVGSAIVTTQFSKIAPNTHLQVNISLEAATGSACFDGLLGTGLKTDTNCGGANCPACGIGQKCSSNTDCADPTRIISCQFVPVGNTNKQLCSSTPPSSQ